MVYESTWSFSIAQTSTIVVVDASESADATRQTIVHTVLQLLDKLPGGRTLELFFLGSVQSYRAFNFASRQKAWFRQHSKRASLIAPIMKTQRKQRRLGGKIVVVGTGEIFDLADWVEEAEWLLLRAGDAPLATGLSVTEMSAAD